MLQKPASHLIMLSFTNQLLTCLRKRPHLWRPARAAARQGTWQDLEWGFVQGRVRGTPELGPPGEDPFRQATVKSSNIKNILLIIIWIIHNDLLIASLRSHYKKHIHILDVTFTLVVLGTARNFGPGALFGSAGWIQQYCSTHGAHTELIQLIFGKFSRFEVFFFSPSHLRLLFVSIYQHFFYYSFNKVPICKWNKNISEAVHSSIWNYIDILSISKILMT